jgi:hypothetical protein
VTRPCVCSHCTIKGLVYTVIKALHSCEADRKPKLRVKCLHQGALIYKCNTSIKDPLGTMGGAASKAKDAAAAARTKLPKQSAWAEPVAKRNTAPNPFSKAAPPEAARNFADSLPSQRGADPSTFRPTQCKCAICKYAVKFFYRITCFEASSQRQPYEALHSFPGA